MSHNFEFISFARQLSITETVYDIQCLILKDVLPASSFGETEGHNSSSVRNCICVLGMLLLLTTVRV